MSRLSPVICACALLLISGCSDGKGDVSEKRLADMAGGTLKETVAVSGVVTIDGDPAAGVNLHLFKEDGKGPLMECRTDKEGKYCWSTNLSCDGLEPGTYKLAFTHIPKPRKNDAGIDLFKGKYRNPLKNEFTLTVESGAPQTDVNYELKTK